MNGEVEAAIIAAIATIVTPVITLYLKNRHERRAFQDLDEDRRSALTGKWKGVAHQAVGPEGGPLELAMDLELAASRKTVTGVATFQAVVHGNEFRRSFNVDGGFIHQRFLMLRYSHVDPATVEFGSMTFELSADAKELRGRYLGYGALSERLIYGSIDFKKLEQH